jgi:hypothetical protein
LPKPVAVVHDGDADMLLGSRLNSEIRADTMSPLHQDIENLLLTKLLNRFHNIGVSDAHSLIMGCVALLI